jgi:hypothetical protein
MALVEKTRQIEEVYLVTVCDDCGSEDVTTNINDMVYCDACMNKQSAPMTPNQNSTEAVV